MSILINTADWADNERNKRPTIGKFAAILFLVSPIISLFYAIKHYRSSWSKNILWAFVVFYGFTMVISSEGIDAAYYRDNLYAMNRQALTWENFTDLLYGEETNTADIVQPFVSYALSRFTSNERILFAVFGLIFGYFYSRNIWYILNLGEQGFNRYALLFIVIFALVNPFWNINGFRMWTAAQLFFFGAIQFLAEDKKKGILIAVCALFVHFSFVLPLLILLIYLVFGNRYWIYYVGFISSFFVSEIDISLVRDKLLHYSPSFLESRVTGYTNEVYLKQALESSLNREFHAIIYGKLLKWSILIMITYVLFRGKECLKFNPVVQNLVSFSLLFLAVANISSMIPSGGRFMTVANMFAIASIFLYARSVSPVDNFRHVVYMLYPVLIFFAIVSVWMGFVTIGVMGLVGNPIIAVFGNVDVALIELIK